MLNNVSEIKNEALKNAAGLMMNRMISAPKGKGKDDVSIILVDGAEKSALAAEMRTLGEARKRPGLIRDANNVGLAEYVIIAGSQKIVMNLDCGFCSVPTCAESIQKDLNCAFPTADLGIAIGSGLSLAQQMGIDCRVMYTIGLAAVSLNLFKNDKIRVVLGIPLSISSKNVFFDRA